MAMMAQEKKPTAARVHQMIIALLAEIAPEADFEQLALDDDIRFELDIDSFDFLNFLIGLNEKTGVEIPEADYGRLSSIDDITTYILTHG